MFVVITILFVIAGCLLTFFVRTVKNGWSFKARLLYGMLLGVFLVIAFLLLITPFSPSSCSKILLIITLWFTYFYFVSDLHCSFLLLFFWVATIVDFTINIFL